MIIENKIRKNDQCKTVYLYKRQWEYQNQGEMLMVEEDYPLERNWPKLIQMQEFFDDECRRI